MICYNINFRNCSWKVSDNSMFEISGNVWITWIARTLTKEGFPILETADWSSLAASMARNIQRISKRHSSPQKRKQLECRFVLTKQGQDRIELLYRRIIRTDKYLNFNSPIIRTSLRWFSFCHTIMKCKLLSEA